MFNNEVRDTYVAVAQAIFFMLGFALVMLHVVGIFAPCIARDFR